MTVQIEENDVDIVSAHKREVAKLAAFTKQHKVLRPKDEGLDLSKLDKDAEIAKYSDDVEPLGWSIIVRLYTEPQTIPDGTKYLNTDAEHAEQVYNSFLGLVVSIGPLAWIESEESKKLGLSKYHSGPWCNVGDFIVFPRTAGYYLYFDGNPLFVIKEHAPDVRIKDRSVNSVKRK